MKNKVIKLDARDWKIIHKSPKDEVELSMFLCTGIFAYQIGKKDPPYLVAHSGPTQDGGILPALAMQSVLLLHEFNESPGSDERISLNEILIKYKDHLMQEGNLGHEPKLGIYLASGLRVNPTDLAIARFFLLDDNYELMGAELNRTARVNVKPLEGLIQFFDMARGKRTEHYLTYNIGKGYDINLRTKN